MCIYFTADTADQCWCTRTRYSRQTFSRFYCLHLGQMAPWSSTNCGVQVSSVAFSCRFPHLRIGDSSSTSPTPPFRPLLRGAGSDVGAWPPHLGTCSRYRKVSLRERCHGSESYTRHDPARTHQKAALSLPLLEYLF